MGPTLDFNLHHQNRSPKIRLTGRRARSEAPLDRSPLRAREAGGPSLLGGNATTGVPHPCVLGKGGTTDA
jgi:hypothetical protein